MLKKRRLSPQESRAAALEAARELLIEQGPQAVTLKAVAARIGRTHANVLHHFGTAAELYRELASYLTNNICTVIAQAVIATRIGAGSARTVVDLTFDAFEREGGAQLASWLRLNGTDDGLTPIVDAVQEMVEDLHDVGSHSMRHVTQTLILLALGDALMGAPLSTSLGLPRSTARDMAEQLLTREGQRLGLLPKDGQGGFAPAQVDGSASEAASQSGARPVEMSSTLR